MPGNGYMHGDSERGSNCDGYVQQRDFSSDDWACTWKSFDGEHNARERRGVWVDANFVTGGHRDGDAGMHQHFSEHHVQHRAEYHHLDRKSDKRCNCGEHILQRRRSGVWTIATGRLSGRLGDVVGRHVAVRSNVDIQTASASGAFVWSSGVGCGRNVGMQQFAKIAGRTGNASRIVSVGCDGHSAEWGSLAREPFAERVAIAERSA